MLEGAAVDEIVVVARLAGVRRRRRRRRVSSSPSPTLHDRADRTRSTRPRGLAHVTLDGVTVAGRPGARHARARPPRSASSASSQEADGRRSRVEIVGTCQTIFDITLDYAKQREQFGVPIGSFQAIKHKFADMLVALERARAIGYFAALTIAEDDERRAIATSVAKAAAGDCERLIAKEGIQIHGGIGYTWEHDMHLYVRRVKSDTHAVRQPARAPRARRRRASASEPAWPLGQADGQRSEDDHPEQVPDDHEHEAGADRVLVVS